MQNTMLCSFLQLDPLKAMIILRRKIVLIKTGIFIMLFSSLTQAQSGMLDPSFDPGNGANGPIYSMALKDDGRILIGGDFSMYNGIGMNNIAVLNGDGTLESAFNPGTGTDPYVRSVALNANGGVILSGDFSTYDGANAAHIAQANSDGSFDGVFNFNLGSGPNSLVYQVKVQNDRKILVGGLFSMFNGVAKGGINRLNSDGTLDVTFDAGPGTNDMVFAIAIQSDGKIIIGGQFITYNGVSRNGIARLNSDGSLDTSFNPGSGVNGTVYSIALQSDGKIIIAGNFTSYNGTERNRIARLNTNGSVDGAFDPGAGANDHVLASAVQNDDKIIIGGLFTSYAGTFRDHVARLNSNGTLDTTFDPGLGTEGPVSDIVIQPDGNIFICGSFTSYDGVSRNGIARISGSPTAIVERSPAEFLSIHPNPFSTHTMIHAEEHFRNGTLVVHNSAGAEVARMENLSGNTITLQRDGLASGLYLVRFTADDKHYQVMQLMVVDN